MQEIKARCRDLGIASIHWLKVRCMIALDPDSPSREAGLKALEKKHPTRFKRLDEGRVQVGFTPEEAKLPHVFLHWVFQQLEA